MVSALKENGKRKSYGFVAKAYSDSKYSSGFGGTGGNPLRSRICFIASACICSGTGAQRLNWVAQKALPCVELRSSSAIPKLSETGISALTVIMSSSDGMSKILPRRLFNKVITELRKSLGTLHSKLSNGSSSFGSLSRMTQYIGRHVIGIACAGPLRTG